MHCLFHSSGFIADERLLSNGFTVEVNPSPKIVAVPGAINFTGAAELVEILGKIRRDPDVSLAESRPLKVRHFLEGEAVRLGRQNAPGIEKEELRKLVGDTRDLKELQLRKCLHGKEVTRKLFHVPNRS